MILNNWHLSRIYRDETIQRRFKFMKTLKIKTTLLAIALVLGQASMGFAAEGGNAGGGGDAVPVKGKWTLLDLAESSEYFNPTDGYDALEVRGWFEIEYLRNAESCMATSLDDNGWTVKIHELFAGASGTASGFDLSSFGRPNGRLKWKKTNTPLENIKDEGQIRYIDPASKRQVAIQKNGIVTVYSPIYDLMDSANRAALVLHETILFIVLNFNESEYQQHGTENIRRLVHILARPKEEFSPYRSEAVELCGANGSVINNYLKMDGAKSVKLPPGVTSDGIKSSANQTTILNPTIQYNGFGRFISDVSAPSICAAMRMKYVDARIDKDHADPAGQPNVVTINNQGIATGFSKSNGSSSALSVWGTYFNYYNRISSVTCQQ